MLMEEYLMLVRENAPMDIIEKKFCEYALAVKIYNSNGQG